MSDVSGSELPPGLDVEEAGELLRRGVEQADGGDPVAAEANFKRLIASGYFAEWAHFHLGMARLAQGETERAIEAFADAIDLEPTLFWAHYRRLLAGRDSGVPPEVLAQWSEQALEIAWEPLQHSHAMALTAVAAALSDSGHADVARSLVERLPPVPDETEAPNTSPAVVSDAGGEVDAPAYAEASPNPAGDESVSETGDAGGAPAPTLSPEDAADLFRRAEAALGEGAIADATRDFERLAASGLFAQWALFHLGRIYAPEADPGRALRAFTAAIESEPTFFWAHYERLVLAAAVHEPAATLAGFADALCEIPWEALQDGHVSTLGSVAHAIWDGEERVAAARLLRRLWPSDALDRLALVRLVESNVDPAISRTLVERLEQSAELDEPALRVLSQYHQRFGDLDREISALERTWDSAPGDGAIGIDLVRAYARRGDRDRAFAIIRTSERFSARDRSAASLNANVELGEVDAAFRDLRDLARIHGDVPKMPAIRLAYLLGDAFDTPRRDEVLALLSAALPADTDVALARVNAAIRDQRWDAARAMFEKFLDGGQDDPESVRVARIDILAYTGQLQAAAELLQDERIDGVVQPAFLRSTLRVLAELGRWDEAFDAGVAALGHDPSFRHVLSPLVRAARKTNRGVELLNALLGLRRPLGEPTLHAIYAVAEDLAEAGDRSVLARIADLPLPVDRRSRIDLKLRASSAPSPSEPDIAIFYCADDAYLVPALVSLTSLVATNASLAKRAVFHLVVDSDVLNRARRVAAPVARRLGFRLEIVDAAEVVSSAEGLRTAYGIVTGGQQLALAAYYRIFFARWLVAQGRFRQALYVDADTVVRSGLEEVFTLDRGGPLLARPETDRPEVRRATLLHGLEGAYFNSGILCFDLIDPMLPALLDRAIEAALDEAIPLVFQDQCALNIGFDRNYGELPARFNYFNPPDASADAVPAEEAVIVHYLDRPKPWDSLYRKRAREWFDWYDLVETLCQDLDDTDGAAPAAQEA